MSDWDLNEVSQWLIGNGFEKYVQRFRDEDIDGAALIELREGEILQLLTLIDQHGIRRNPATRIQQRFRNKLEDLKKPKRKRRRSDDHAWANDRLIRSTAVQKSPNSSKTLLIKSLDPKLKFLGNHFISSHLTKYYSKIFRLQLNLPLILHAEMKDDILIEFLGEPENLKKGLPHFQSLFSSVKFHIFNEENLDKKILKCSERISSASSLIVLQKIFFEKNKLTVWEKTKVLSGSFAVFYLDGGEEFQTKVDFLRQTLNKEVAMIKDLTLLNLSSMSKQCRNEFEEFVRARSNHPSMTIISLQYPFQIETQMIFFGLKSTLRIAKNQLRIFISKHQMKTIQLDLHSTQRQFLLDYCQEKLKKIELDFQLNNVKISIHQNVFVAPNYLIETIRQLIYSMIYQATTLNYPFMPDAFQLTSKIEGKLKNLIRSYRCQLKTVRVQTTNQFLRLPRNSFHEESKGFLSSISRRKVLCVASNVIEIQQSSDSKFDIEVISTIEDAQKEQIDATQTNIYLESNGGRRILFIQWSPSSSTNEQAIEKFFSLSLSQIVEHCASSVETIRYGTTGWNESPARREILPQLIKQLQRKKFADRSWRIVFICDKNQNGLFEEFLHNFPESNEEFIQPISTLRITLEGTDNMLMSKCQRGIEDLIRGGFLREAQILSPFDENRWNSSMIAVFYQFCLNQHVLPNLKTNLELTGMISDVEKVKEKYHLISRINRLKVPLIPMKAKSKRFNILLSCSSLDRTTSTELANRLMAENYLVSVDCSDEKNLSILSKIDRTDLILICFTWNYLTNLNCKSALETVQSSGKKCIPIVLVPQNENLWIEMMQLEERFYEIFQKEIQFRFEDNFDRLLCELLRYTKPGVVGKMYPLEDLIVNEETHREQIPMQSETKLEISLDDKQPIYDLYVKKTLEKEKILEEEMKQLIESLEGTLHDYSDENSRESLLEGNDPYFQSFLEQLQRWIAQALIKPLIKGNFKPFTVTGDFNDAIFPVWSPEKSPWWEREKNLDPFDHSIDTTDESILIGSWFNSDEAHQYYERLIDKDIQFQGEQIRFEDEEKLENNRIDDVKISDENQNTEGRRTEEKPIENTGAYFRFDTYIKKGTAAWDIQYDRLFSKKCPKRDAEYRAPSKLWSHLIDENVQLISDLKKGKISRRSNRIGSEEKSREERRKRDAFDQPTNRRWKRILRLLKTKEEKQHFRRFIAKKIENTNQWKHFSSQ